MNLLPETPSYTVVNLRGEYRVSDTLRLFARIEKICSTRNMKPSACSARQKKVFPEFEDHRFYGAGPPLGAWVGVRATF